MTTNTLSVEENRQRNWAECGRRLANSIFNERIHQLGKWGYQHHSPAEWCSILGEEFGEAAKEVNELIFSTNNQQERVTKLKAELIQVAAVAIAFIQDLETGEA